MNVMNSAKRIAAAHVAAICHLKSLRRVAIDARGRRNLNSPRARPFKSASGLWVLEIQIRHPERPFGAFFEDLLHDADGR